MINTVTVVVVVVELLMFFIMAKACVQNMGLICARTVAHTVNTCAVALNGSVEL